MFALIVCLHHGCPTSEWPGTTGPLATYPFKPPFMLCDPPPTVLCPITCPPLHCTVPCGLLLATDSPYGIALSSWVPRNLPAGFPQPCTSLYPAQPLRWQQRAEPEGGRGSLETWAAFSSCPIATLEVGGRGSHFFPPNLYDYLLTRAIYGKSRTVCAGSGFEISQHEEGMNPGVNALMTRLLSKSGQHQ